MRRLVEDTAITVTRGVSRFRVRVFRWIGGKARRSAVWSPTEIDRIRKAMGKAR